jgi:hypothetical protein
MFVVFIYYMRDNPNRPTTFPALSHCVIKHEGEWATRHGIDKIAYPIRLLSMVNTLIT